MATVQYLYAGSGAPAAEVRSGTTRAYQFDGMRSTRQMVDTAGSVTDTFGFDLLGNVRSRSGSTPTPFTWNVGAGKTGSTTGLFFQDRSWPRRRGSSAGWGSGWDPSGGFDFGALGTRGLPKHDFTILSEILGNGLEQFVRNGIVVDGKLVAPFLKVAVRTGNGNGGGSSGGRDSGLPLHLIPGPKRPGGPGGKLLLCEEEPTSPCNTGGGMIEACIAIMCSMLAAYELYDNISDLFKGGDVWDDKVKHADPEELKDGLKWFKSIFDALVSDDPFTRSEECCTKAKKALDVFDVAPSAIQSLCQWLRGQDIAAAHCAKVTSDQTSCNTCCRKMFEHNQYSLCENICTRRHGGSEIWN